MRDSGEGLGLGFRLGLGLGLGITVRVRIKMVGYSKRSLFPLNGLCYTRSLDSLNAQKR